MIIISTAICKFYLPRVAEDRRISVIVQGTCLTCRDSNSAIREIGQMVALIQTAYAQSDLYFLGWTARDEKEKLYRSGRNTLGRHDPNRDH